MLELGLVLMLLAAEARPDAPAMEVHLLIVDGRALVDLRVDLDALLLGMGPGASGAERVMAMERLRDVQLEEAVESLDRLFRRRVRLRFDGHTQPFEVSFPEEKRSDDGRGLVTLGSLARLSAVVPPGARDASFFASRAFGEVELHVETATSRLVLRLGRGEISPAVLLAR